MALCERTFAFPGVMRALAESGHEGYADDDLRSDVLDEDLVDEVEPQQLDDLQLGMAVRTDADSDGAGVAG